MLISVTLSGDEKVKAGMLWVYKLLMSSDKEAEKSEFQ